MLIPLPAVSISWAEDEDGDPEAAPDRTAWHGAAPDQFMAHLALRETDDVTWLDHVTDDEYTGPRASTRREAHSG